MFGRCVPNSTAICFCVIPADILSLVSTTRTSSIDTQRISFITDSTSRLTQSSFVSKQKVSNMIPFGNIEKERSVTNILDDGLLKTPNFVKQNEFHFIQSCKS